MTAASPVQRLMRWYQAQCNGEWEHDYGVTIQTLDNPGWLLQVHLVETPLQGKGFATISRGRLDLGLPGPDLSSWIECSVEADIFHGAGGIDSLEELVRIFVDWAEGVEE